MVGKRSGKALLREEGKRHPQCLSKFDFALKADEMLFCRPGEDRQQHGSDHMASDQSDQSEELLHVSYDCNGRNMWPLLLFTIFVNYWTVWEERFSTL